MESDLLISDTDISSEEISFIDKNISGDYRIYKPLMNNGNLKVLGTIMAATIYITEPNIINTEQIHPYTLSIDEMDQLENSLVVESDYTQIQQVIEQNISSPLTINEDEESLIENNLITTYNSVMGDFIRSRKRNLVW